MYLRKPLLPRPSQTITDQLDTSDIKPIIAIDEPFLVLPIIEQSVLSTLLRLNWSIIRNNYGIWEIIVFNNYVLHDTFDELSLTSI